MRFCSVCDNMLYIRAAADKTVYACKMCNTIEPLSHDGGAVMITDSQLTDENIKYRMYLSPFLVQDPTMPHVSNIVCPNETCSKQDSTSNDVVVVKYDADKLRFLYMCAHCGQYWLNTKDANRSTA
jgi:DNA-directed RNA polymerase subunit M/transcription elongation factor TFIIS